LGGRSVSDASLTRCISQLRRTLPDINIESFYGRGYRLSHGEPVVHKRLAAATQAPPHVVSAFLFARSLAHRTTPKAQRQSVVMMRKLTADVPDYAPAYVGLASGIGMLLAAGVVLDQDSYLKEAVDALDQAERIDPTCVGIAACRAWLQDMMWHFDAAEALHQQALAESPDDAEVRAWYIWHCLVTRQFDAALLHSRKALSLEPTSDYLRSMVARSLAGQGLLHAALQEISGATDDALLHPMAAGAELYLRAGLEPSPALIPLARRLHEQPDMSPYGYSILPYVCAKCGQADEARRLVDLQLNDNVSPIGAKLSLVPAMLALGDNEAVVELLEKAYEARACPLPFALSVLGGHPLRHDERVKRVMAGVAAEISR